MCVCACVCACVCLCVRLFVTVTLICIFIYALIYDSVYTTTRNIFKREKLIWRTLKLLFILFDNLDICRSTSEVMELQLKYFVFFPCTWGIKLLNTSKTKAFFWQFQVMFYIYLDIGRDDHDDYNDGESSGKGYYE